ncbi:hypothetical protein BC834DRAFT_965503 [Gloeopeniophorella convolvens]|nr:hypothetical protein BC834DRAFT_965503 [Gloeopeniophorella convolvens]
MQQQSPPPPLESSPTPEAVQKRLAKHTTLGIPHLPNVNIWHPRKKSKPPPEHPDLSNDDATTIDLIDPSDEDLLVGGDMYRWAIVYENQRGITVFSVAYYSRLGLLPHDPPPFTVPEADGRRDKQPQVTLEDYLLPDGTWRWVSRAWMVDMRSEGEVHYDGFEYNWVFRRHKWRPEPGLFNAGGWVRRRRWVRLMMRPASPTELGEGEGSPNPVASSSSAGYSIVAENSALELEMEKALVWRGDSDDWKRCRHLMIRVDMDGSKLELWQDWLGFHPSARRRAVWTEDDYSLPSEKEGASPATQAAGALDQNQRKNLADVVRDHLEDLLQMFVYPESRLEFLEILSGAGVVSRDKFPSVLGSTGMGFWSYSRGLSDVATA